MKTTPDLVSLNRLRGEKCPEDLAILITRGSDLLAALGVEISGEATWQPWADKSYLTEDDLKNPDIAANVRAIDDTFRCIDFVARLEDELYIGYWRGPQGRLIQDSPLVSYDSEGQFALCGSRFAESLCFAIWDKEALGRFRAACDAFGIPLRFDSLDDIVIPAVDPDPQAFHLARYYSYKNAAPNAGGNAAAPRASA